jgi:uncharacterized protein YhfF
VCVVETVAVEVKRFADVDTAFAYDYGAWDRTFAGWRTHSWALRIERCRALGKTLSPEMPFVCERFRGVHAYISSSTAAYSHRRGKASNIISNRS